MRGLCVRVLGLVALAMPALGDVIYTEGFGGPPSADLNGTNPDSGWTAIKWIASPNWKADGSKSVSGNSNAWLPFKPNTGNVFTLSLDVNPTAIANDDWFALGWAQNPNTTNDFQNAANGTVAWMLNRQNDASPSAVQTFLGPSTSGGASHDFDPDKVGWVNLKIVLNTQPANWTVEWFVDNVSIRGPVAFSTNPTINYVGFSGYSTATGVVDNFSLTSLNPVPPVMVMNTAASTTGFSVSATDLLNGLVPIVNDMNLIRPEEGQTTNNPAALTNGAFGDPGLPGGANVNEVVAIHNGAVLTYLLDLKASPDGYAIMEIATYAGWRDPGRDGQQYDIRYSLVTDPDTFLPLASANYNPAIGSPSDTAVQFLMSDGSPLVSGVAALRFEFPITENGYVGYREIDVFGVALTVVPEPATLSVLALGAVGLIARRRRARR